MSAPSTTAQVVAALEAGLATLLSAPAARRSATAEDMAKVAVLEAGVINLARRVGERHR